MIYDTLANAHLYQGISDRLQKGLDFLIHSNFASLPDGRYEIDGDDVLQTSHMEGPRKIRQMQKRMTYISTSNF